MSSLTITQRRSAVGSNPSQRKTLESLGLGRPGKTAVRKDSDQLRGQIAVISHLVEVEEGK